MKKYLIITFVILFSLLAIWINMQIQNYKNDKLDQKYFTELNFDYFIDKYKLLAPFNSNSIAYLKKAFYKAYSLENKNKSKEAIEFWKILQNSNENEHKMYAYLYLGVDAKNQKNYVLADSYFTKPLLIDPVSKLFPLAIINIAEIAYAQNNLDSAICFLRMVLNEDKIKNLNVDAELLKKLKSLAGEININRLYTRKITSNSVDHKIRNGDMLATLAEQYRTTVDLIMKTNSLNSAVLRLNNHLKIINSVFSIKVNKTTNVLTVLENGEFFKEYIVGTGRDNVTPVGTFKIVDKQINPTWFRHDGSIIPYGSKENLLGTRWISINYPGYGIHGTWDDDSVGKQSSAGCIRLRKSDVEELFLYITVNSEVKIFE